MYEKLEEEDLYSVEELRGKANELITVQRGDSKKMQETFWDYLSKKSKKVSSLIKLATKNELSKTKYPTALDNISNEYKIWVEKFNKKHNKERERTLEAAKIHTDCTKIIFRAPNAKSAARNGAIFDAVSALSEYCKNWEKISERNLAEKAYYSVYIKPTLKLSLPSLPQDEAKRVLLTPNSPGGLVPLASIAKALHSSARGISRLIKEKEATAPESLAACKLLVNEY
jgi:hypothetical protein